MSRSMRRISLAAIATVLAMVALLPTVGAAPLGAETKTVSMKDFKFDPKTITVNVGDTITWTNNDTAEHTAQADDSSFDSKDVAGGKSFSTTFAKAGTFAYYCKYHGGPNGAGMAGTVVVQEAAAQVPTAVAAPAGAAPTGSIDVANQAVANDAITVASATISQDGWIAVHKAGPDGKLLLTPLVGLIQIKAGDNKNVVIKLTEPVAAGAPLWPMLHIDAGTIGTYEFPNGADVPVAANGAPVMKQITVAAAGAPTTLPSTGGDGFPGWLAVVAVALLAAGALLFGVTRRQAR